MATSKCQRDVSKSKMKIDRKVARLVRVLNSLPGVSTFSSCGGHAKPTIVSQCPINEWYVNFSLLPHQMAWQSLELIASARCEFMSGDALVTLTVWHDAGVNFELSGVDVKADEFAAFIEQLSNNA